MARLDLVDADDAARLAQRLLDWRLRPRSVECWPAYQDIVARAPRPGAGWVRLPGTPEPMKRKR